MKQQWWLGKRGEWYVVIQFVILALVVFGPRGPSWPAPWTGIGLLLGLFLGLVGGLLGLTGLRSLGQNLTAVPHPLDDGQLVTGGAYRFVRHPIYSGIILAAFGFGLTINGFLTLLYGVVLFLFFDIKSRREEKWLVEKYADYSAYQKRARKLIPFIY